MKQPKKTVSIIFWTATTIIFIMEGVIPALTAQTEMAKEGVRHLGYPQYFGNAVIAVKILGSLALIIPAVPARLKEWAYAGFTFTFIFACISHWVVDGFGFQTIMPLIFLGILMISYIYWHKACSAKRSSTAASGNPADSYIVTGLSQ